MRKTRTQIGERRAICTRERVVLEWCPTASAISRERSSRCIRGKNYTYTCFFCYFRWENVWYSKDNSSNSSFEVGRNESNFSCSFFFRFLWSLANNLSNLREAMGLLLRNNQYGLKEEKCDNSFSLIKRQRATPYWAVVDTTDEHMPDIATRSCCCLL